MAAVLEEHELGAADVGGELLGAHGRVPRAEAQGPSWPMSSVPGLTAIHDSEWLESSVPARQVPGFGNVCPGGTG